MIKIIRFGGELKETGERRVEILDTNLVKVASNDIQNFWDKLEKAEDKAYLHVIAMTAMEYYSPNNNGDAFKEADLKKYHPTFISKGHIFLHHINKDPKRSIGKPIFSFYNDKMHRVELVLEIDKNNPLAEKTVSAIKRGDDVFVSMGVKVLEGDQCSICGNRSKTRAQYCDHLKFNLRKILPDGRQVFAINPAPLEFFDISIVSRPADKIAWALQKAASEGDNSEDLFSASSAELGEQYETAQRKLAAINKFSEIIKEVDGDIIKAKDSTGDTPIRKILSSKSIDFPTIDCSTFDKESVSPGGMLRIIFSRGVSPSIHEVVHASARHHFGSTVTPDISQSIMRLLPRALDILRNSPEDIGTYSGSLLGNYNNELEDRDLLSRVFSAIDPIVRRRIVIIKHAASEKELCKLAYDVADALDTEVGVTTPVPINTGNPGIRRFLDNYGDRRFSSLSPGQFDTFTVKGTNGKTYKTNRVNIQLAQDVEDISAIAKKLLGGALTAASLGALLSDRDLLTKLISSGALGAVAYKLLTSSKEKGTQIVGHSGVEIPSSTAFYEAEKNLIGESLEKRAGIFGKTRPLSNSSLLRSPYIAPLFGMAIPTGLMLDYLYNKKIRHKNDPYYRQNLGAASRAMDSLGETITNNPMTSLFTGATVGSISRAGLKHNELKRRIIRNLAKKGR